MTISKLEKELEDAQARWNQRAHAGLNPDEYLQAHAAVLSLERKVAAERMEEYAEILDFPVKWDIGAPMPYLIAGSRKFLGFYLKDKVEEGKRVESVALVQFHGCISVKFGTPDENVLHGHYLYGRGLEPYTAQLVCNSKWIKELEATNKVLPDYNQERWRSFKHYIFWFHDESFECVARAFQVEVFQKSLDEVILEATKRALV